jgi:hypothetical protein
VTPWSNFAQRWVSNLLRSMRDWTWPAKAQSEKLVMEEFMVPANDPGIEIYVRNKHPASMTTFTPERTLLFVHGSTYPAHRVRSAARRNVLDGLHRFARVRRISA